MSVGVGACKEKWGDTAKGAEHAGGTAATDGPCHPASWQRPVADGAILAAGDGVPSVWRDGHGADFALVASETGKFLGRGQVPGAHGLIHAAGDNELAV